MCVMDTGFPDGSDGKESACNAGDPGSIPGLGRSPGQATDEYTLKTQGPVLRIQKTLICYVGDPFRCSLDRVLNGELSHNP